MYPTIESSVREIFNATWNITNGAVVPETDDVVMKNGGRRIDATYLYADLANSSGLAHKFDDTTTATIIRAYINTASRILNQHEGEIRSFDGDRVMAIFIGKSKNTNAVRAALAINWAVIEVLRPAIETKWTDVAPGWTINHGVGVDTGEALIVRGGVRDNNDLISIGRAPNQAAKLSELRTGYSLNITADVYDNMHEENKYLDDGKTPMWKREVLRNTFTGLQPIYRSNAMWGV